jgi:uncharacterized protein (DUF1800 family)
MAETTKSEDFAVEHLLRRAGFGYTPDELAYYKNLGFDATLDELLHPEKVKNDALDRLLNDQNFDFTDMGDLRRWWIYRMVYSKRPLEEKLTLFWHGHFATGNAKVNNPYMMYQQNQIFRERGLGRFHDLILAVSRDPAMILWLDNQQNRKGNPNENFAREVMELFTIGIGNYSEQDVKEAARAFTGWQAPEGFYFNRKQHDSGPKSILGQKGNFNGDDVVGILASLPACGTRLARKLISFFCTDDPSDDFIDRVSQVYLSSEQNMREVLRAIFTDPVFVSDRSYHQNIKSPAELVVGTVKTLQVKKLDGDLPALMARMGQNLFEPPNVKGWDGGMNWIATDTMMERFNFAARITGGKFDAVDGYIVPAQMASNYKLTNAKDMVEYFLNLLVDDDVPRSTKKRLLTYVQSDLSGKQLDADQTLDAKTLDAKMRGLIHLVMTLPTYQLA